jgi:sulfonate transport system ATP-binding protein
VLLLVEPFSAVDAMTRIVLQDLLLELAVRHATTVLLVTHDVEEALILADRVIVMQRSPGAPPTEVVNLRRPRERSDAKFNELRQTVLDRLRVSSTMESRSVSR